MLLWPWLVVIWFWTKHVPVGEYACILAMNGRENEKFQREDFFKACDPQGCPVGSSSFIVMKYQMKAFYETVSGRRFKVLKK